MERRCQNKPFVRPRGLGLFLVLVGVFLLSACRLDDNRLRGSIRSFPPDFKKTEIKDFGPAVANDSDTLRVEVWLKSSNNRVVVDYRPEFEEVGAGVTFSPCTKSNDLGLSVCDLRSNQPGVKLLRLANALVGLEHEVEFSAVGSESLGQALGFISMSQTEAWTVTEDHWAEYSLGDWVDEILVETSEPTPLFEGYLSVQGIFSSF